MPNSTHLKRTAAAEGERDTGIRSLIEQYRKIDDQLSVIAERVEADPMAEMPVGFNDSQQEDLIGKQVQIAWKISVAPIRTRSDLISKLKMWKILEIEQRSQDDTTVSDHIILSICEHLSID